MAARVLMYSTTHCGYCRRARQLLIARGIPFDDINVTNDREIRTRVVAETGHWTVPVILIDGELIGGSDELLDLDRAGKLDGLRGETPG